MESKTYNRHKPPNISRVWWRVHDLLLEGGLCLNLDQIQRFFDCNGQPLSTSPLEIRCAWMRGRQARKREAPF